VLDQDGWQTYRDEQQNIVANASLVMMGSCIGLVALADWTGVESLRLPLLVLGMTPVAMNVLVLLLLTRLTPPSQADS
jgi:hypothetical protein